MPGIVILASGEGTTFEAIANAVLRGEIKARISGLICNHSGAGAVRKAEALGIPVHLCTRKPDIFKCIDRALSELDPDLIVLAGFMRILPDDLVLRYGNRMINTHPALLPCFGGIGYYGERVHKAVIESGAKISGCSVHFVTVEVDSGPIIAQAAVQVLDTDDHLSLAERVHAAETGLLVDSIRKLLSQPYEIKGKRVIFS